MPKGVYIRTAEHRRQLAANGRVHHGHCGRPVYSVQQPGVRWESRKAAARALGCSPALVDAKVDGPRRCKGHLLVSTPPAWAAELAELAEARRLATTKVGGCSVGPAVRSARRVVAAAEAGRQPACAT